MKTDILVIGDKVIKVEIADSIWNRIKGLLGRTGLPEGTGMLITGCSSIHTVFMKFAIDVVYLDAQMTVCGIRECMKSFEMSSCPGACMTLELPAGSIERYGIAGGDKIRFGEDLERDARPEIQDN